MAKIKLIIFILIALSGWFLFKGEGKPTPTGFNTEPIDVTAGFKVSEIMEGVGVPVDQGILEEVIPMVEFECSGKVYQKKKDRQDGFKTSITVVYGKLTEPDIFEHLCNEGTMNKTFDDGFKLTTGYFRSHIAAFYIHPASDNIHKAVSSLEVGDSIRLKGNMVYLKTKNGLLKTSLNPDEFKCKYVYINEVIQDDSIFL